MRPICQAIILTLFLTLIAGQSYAVPHRSISFVVSGSGATFASAEPYTDFYNFGPGGSLGIAYPITPKWSFGLELSANMFAPDKSSVATYLQSKHGANSVAGVEDGNIVAVSLDFSGRRYFVGPAQQIQPYLKAGYGLTHFTSSEINATYTTALSTSIITDRPSTPEISDLSLFVGFGLESGTGNPNLSLFGEATYRLLLEEQDRVGIAGARLGVKF